MSPCLLVLDRPYSPFRHSLMTHTFMHYFKLIVATHSLVNTISESCVSALTHSFVHAQMHTACILLASRLTNPFAYEHSTSSAPVRELYAAVALFASSLLDS